ncbi:MAG TPA: hopanoid-associated sugar epimerase [Gemmatimonadaceae bacterium]|nr:hopanoid-associated sugar epimerase [Gemmatimonadaceae bacterium]
MRALVTGATGFVGAAVARHLLAAGHRVRVLARPNNDRRNLQHLDVEITEGDLTDPASLARATRECQAVFHVAADYRLWVPDPKTMYAANVDGTRAVVEAALDSGVDRIVYTSSVATLGYAADGKPADEDTPSNLNDMIGHYKRSKFLAEEAVREKVITVNPSTPVGPGDIKPTPTGRMIRDAINGRMPAYVDTGLNIVDVDDVATGHLLAYEKGVVGRRYVLGGTNMTLREILTELARVSGRRPPKWRLSHRAVLPIAYIAEGWAHVSGREPLATVDGVKLSAHAMYFSSARAMRELGYAPGDANAALDRAAEWFKRGAGVWT